MSDGEAAVDTHASSTGSRVVARVKERWSVASFVSRVYINNHVVARLLARRLRMLWYRRVMGFQVGEGSSILSDFRVAEPGKLRIGRHTVVNNSCRFDNRRPITVGDHVAISYGAVLLTLGHDIDSPVFALQGGGIRIEDYVWLCAKCMILPGLTIGKGAVVLPGSVVTHDVPAFSVVGGNPAQFIRKRNEDLRYDLHWDPWIPPLG